MYKRGVEILCKACGINFLPKSSRNIFCCRRCFKKDFAEREEQIIGNKFPTYICSKCHTAVELDFDPAKKGSKWLQFKCPCGNTLTINISDSIVTQESVSGC